MVWEQMARPISPVHNLVHKVVDNRNKLVDDGGEAGITTQESAIAGLWARWLDDNATSTCPSVHISTTRG